MKKLLTIIFVLFATSLVNARGGGHGHSHSHHSSSHSSSGHTSTSTSHSSSGHTTTHHISHGKATTISKATTHPYKPVTRVEAHDIHVYVGAHNNNYLYYYLLFNHNTNTNDTIQSNSKEDLQSQVTEISEEPIDGDKVIVVLAICLLVVVLALVLYNKLHPPIK